MNKECFICEAEADCYNLIDDESYCLTCQEIAPYESGKDPWIYKGYSDVTAWQRVTENQRDKLRLDVSYFDCSDTPERKEIKEEIEELEFDENLIGMIISYL